MGLCTRRAPKRQAHHDRRDSTAHKHDPLLGAPFAEALRGAKALNAALGAITAAVVGVILNLALWFGLHVLFADVRTVAAGPVTLDVPDLTSVAWASLFLSLVAAVAAFRFKVGVIPLLAGCAAGGFGLYMLGATS